MLALLLALLCSEGKNSMTAADFRKAEAPCRPVRLSAGLGLKFAEVHTERFNCRVAKSFGCCRNGRMWTHATFELGNFQFQITGELTGKSGDVLSSSIVF